MNDVNIKNKTSLSEVICVTNRQLCKADFLTRIEQIASKQKVSIILREKDLAEQDYEELAKKVMGICRKNNVSCILHSFVDVAIRLNADAIHLPLHILKEMTVEQKSNFRILGASCHSVEDAKEAETLGCTYITAGHVFETDCKKGLQGRGLPFLQSVCKSVDIPVYAIGGINESNISDVRNAGAKGACIMSGFMVDKQINA